VEAMEGYSVLKQMIIQVKKVLLFGMRYYLGKEGKNKISWQELLVKSGAKTIVWAFNRMSGVYQPFAGTINKILFNKNHSVTV